jgi:penicillin amidase
VRPDIHLFVFPAALKPRRHRRLRFIDPRTAAALAAAATALTAGAFIAVRKLLFRRALPKTAGTLRVAGPAGPIEVGRDRWGVPHIRARSPRDAWFGQGFCQGQDRLWQLHLYRSFASGRLAEFAGAEGLAPDRFVRTLGIRAIAEREAGAAQGPVAEGLAAFAAGVNAAAEAAATLPIEFKALRVEWEPWTAADSLAVAKLLAFALSSNWERELLRAEMARDLGEELATRLDPGYPAGNPIVLEPGSPGARADGLMLSGQIARLRQSLGLAAEATGSNNWAISGERSATGGPLIAGDPHLVPSMPGITYQLGLYVGDRFCRGASLPGVPGVVFGQNNDFVWTFTNAAADVMDLFIERIEGDHYEFEDERRPLVVREEAIAVKGSDPERLVVLETHHGPIVNAALRADDAEPMALAWSGLRFPAIGEPHVAVFEFSDGDDAIGRLAAHHIPVSNLVWADRHGSIGYKLVGRLPVRGGDCPDLPKPGWTGEYEWKDWVPYEEQPEIRDPEAGYVVTANNKIAADDFPHHITSDYFDGYRAQRITEMIEGQYEHDLDGFAGMQLDMLSIPGLKTVHRLARLRPRDQRETLAIERLRSWHGRMEPDSIAASIYQAFTLRLGREVARAAIGDRDLAERWLDRADNGFMTHVSTPWRWQAHLLSLWDEGDEELIGRPWDGLVLDALRAAIDDLSDRFGPDPHGWEWGRVHRLEFPHALGAAHPLLAKLFNRSLEVGGGQETVAQVGWDPNDPFAAIWCPVWRMVADPVAPERSRWQACSGQSGHVSSPHYDDLQERWSEGLTQPMAGEGPWEALELLPATSSASPAGAQGGT